MAFTKGNQIFIHMGSSLCKWKDVVYFFRKRQFSFFPALLAKRMCCDIAVTNTLPRASIPAFAGRVAFMLVIMRRNDLLVFLAIPPICQTRAAGIGTGALWSVWHNHRLLPGIGKAPADFSAKAPFGSTYSCYKYSTSKNK